MTLEEDTILTEQKIIREVLRHAQPSPDTLRFMQETKEEINKLDKKFEIHNTEHKFLVEKLAQLIEKVDGLGNKFDATKDEVYKTLEDDYVNKDSFWPVKTIVYGLVGVILVGVLVAILSQVIKN